MQIQNILSLNLGIPEIDKSKHSKTFLWGCLDLEYGHILLNRTSCSWNMQNTKSEIPNCQTILTTKIN